MLLRKLVFQLNSKLYTLALLLIIITLTAVSSVTNSYSVGAAMTFNDDTNDTWYNAVRDFVYIIYNSRTEWTIGFLSDYPYVGPYMWTEEINGGSDNLYADLTELSLILGHSCLISSPDGTMVVIGFADKGCASPDEIRLGYLSPDDYGNSIWSFIIQCQVLNDNDVGKWLQVMNGVHMILGFVNSPLIASTDLAELAYRLTGTGGYVQESIQDAFFYTFVSADGIHDDNIGRIIAENAYVADYDTLDSFEKQIPVDNVKLIITSWIP